MKRGLSWTMAAAAALLWAGCTGDRKGGAPIDDVPLGDVPATSCAGCHGTEAPWAPPADSRGNTDTTFRGVGSHQAHFAGVVGKAVDCGTCHQVPASVTAEGHIDTSLPAEVAFSGPALRDGLEPSVQSASTEPLAAVTCRNVYCHGASLAGGSAAEPRWNGTPADLAGFGACGSCHGLPPATTRAGKAHPEGGSCADCHGEVVGADGKIADPSKHVDGTVQVAGSGACNGCHGSDDNPAPPLDTKGGSDTAALSVGAHQAHLKAARSRPVQCGACHAVPAALDDPGHMDGDADVAFKDLSVADGATPSWDRAAATCAETYCHGAGLSGGTLTAPKWTKVDGTQAACGTCHGAPPPAPHPSGDDCSDCHGEVINADRTFKDVAKHVDGTLQVDATIACNSCHGNDDNAAPPVDTKGGSDPASKSVGAHQAHLKAARGKPVACETCHKVPTLVASPGHADGVVQVQMKDLAAQDGAIPAWDGTAAKCTNTYCHGATLGGGSLKEPSWNTPGTPQAPCGACHALPPPAPHPANPECASCHGEVVRADRTFLAPEKHVDGTVQADLSSCRACHGNADNAAPPLDTKGGSDPTALSVGAHQAHLKAASGLAAPVPCGTCHRVPADVDAEGHRNGTAEVGMTGTAVADGATPAWDRGTATCAGTYCHGATMAGGTVPAPKWTQADGTQAACGACHALPPPAPHPAGDRGCALCHADTAGPGDVIANPANHVNGVVDVADTRECNACHGGVDNPAPPVDLEGATGTDRVTVGSHQSHLRATHGIAKALWCDDCHKVPQAFGDAGHADTAAPAEVAFQGLARADGASPAWDRDTATCTNTYCHGATRGGGADSNPVWVTPYGSPLDCGSCHAFPPAAPHPASTACQNCHAPTAGAGGTIANPDTHVDGTVQVEMTSACNACHGSVQNAAPPADTAGNTATTVVTVGAHQAHLGATLSTPVACGQCHQVPATAEAPGHVADGTPTAEVTFGALASDDGADPAWDRGTAACTNTYCHGATLGAGGTATAPTWTRVDGSQKACGTCHGAPPPPPHPVSPLCGTCHPGTATLDGRIANPANHVNGTVEARATYECNSCHGGADGNAPPVDVSGNTATTVVTVGAHQAHLKGPSGLANPLACEDCHRVPLVLQDAGHIDTPQPAELTFGNKAKLDGANPAWDRGTARCSSTYCHGATLGAGGTATAPQWTRVDGTQDACGACHGASPGTGRHPSVFGDHSGIGKNCTICHGTTSNTGGTAINDKTRHVNGTVELQASLNWVASARTCDPACHGVESW